MNTAVISVFGGVILLMLGWIKLDLDRRFDRLEQRLDHLADKVGELDSRVSRIEGWIERDRRTRTGPPEGQP